MFALGIGSNIDMDELNGIASDPYIDENGNLVEFVFMATDFDALLSIRSQLRDAACEVTAGMTSGAERTHERSTRLSFVCRVTL